MRNFVHTFPLALVCLAIPAVSSGGAFDARNVPTKAKWVAHLDFDRFVATATADAIVTRIEDGPNAVAYDTIKSIFRIDPLTDIHDVTLYGTDREDTNAVVIFDLSYRHSLLDTFLRSSHNHLGMAHGKHIVHRFDSEKNRAGRIEYETGYACLYDAHTIVYTKSPEQARAALDVLDHKVESLEKGVDELGVPRDAAFFLAALDLEVLVDPADKNTAFLKNARRLMLTLDERDDVLSCHLGVTAVSAEVAAQLTQIASGLIAFGTLNAQKDPGKVWMANLAQKVAVTQNGARIDLRLSLPVGEVVARIQQAPQKEWE